MSMLILAGRQQGTAAGDKECIAIHLEGYGSKEMGNIEFLFLLTAGIIIHNFIPNSLITLNAFFEHFG